MPPLQKFGLAPEAETLFAYPNVWAEQKLANTDRLIIAPVGNQIHLIASLLEKLSYPLGILYVLVVPRTETPVGRYQSKEPVSSEQAVSFLQDFADFFQQDARHNIWIASVDGTGMLIYDRHNVIFAYGPLSGFKDVLLREGLHKTTYVRYPSPHFHNYHSCFDSELKRLIDGREWIHTPLQPQDDE